MLMNFKITFRFLLGSLPWATFDILWHHYKHKSCSAKIQLRFHFASITAFTMLRFDLKKIIQQLQLKFFSQGSRRQSILQFTQPGHRNCKKPPKKLSGRDFYLTNIFKSSHVILKLSVMKKYPIEIKCWSKLKTKAFQ